MLNGLGFRVLGVGCSLRLPQRYTSMGVAGVSRFAVLWA